jgi:hypothetical protein
MEIFFRLLFGHLLADFTFQTNFIADWKRHSMAGLLTHVFIHPVCYILLTWPYLNDTWVRLGGIAITGGVAIVIATVLHFVEDWFRVTRVSSGWADNTLFYVWDQVVHIIVIVLLSPLHSQPLQNEWPVLGCLFVVITHFATVTIWFIEKDIFGREYPETEEKYIAILQRLAVWLVFFLPSPWWMLVLFFVVLSFARHVWTRRVDFTWTSVVMGNALAIACGAISRFGLAVHF